MHQSFGRAAIAPSPRIAAILGAPEAVGCPNMARRLAYESALTVEQARDSLAAAQADVDTTWSEIAAKLNATLPRPRAGASGAARETAHAPPAQTETADETWTTIAKTLSAGVNA